ncbi:MAG: M43 family zinc metalloprotease [Chitinophagaceae bacterium]
MQELSKMVVTGTDTSYEIPVVVHVMHTGGAIGTIYNPTDAAIIKMIDYLNKTWAATWPDYYDVAHGGTKFPFVFKLAKRGPDCTSSTGINRVNASVLSGYTTYGVCPFETEPGPTDAELKTLSLWPPQDYFNIWLVNDIENGGAGGYCPWPWFADGALIDGAVVLAEYTLPVSGSTYYQALPHEIGHGFGLYHTFQDGCHAPSACLSAGDELCDTEPHDFIDMSCYAGKINTCTGVTYAGVEYNFMNYTSCPEKFTPDQRLRTISTMRGYRWGLVNSMGGTAPDPAFVAPKTACVPAITVPSNTENAGPCNIAVGTMNTSSGGYNTDGASYLDRTCIQQAFTLDGGKTYTIDISTRNTAQTVAAWIDYNNDGIFQTTEKIFSHTGFSSDETHSGSFKIPSGVTYATNLRMRVKGDVGVISDACLNVNVGQTEDYTVYINKPASINEFAANSSFRLMPNPAAASVRIEGGEADNYTIRSLDGRVVMDLKQQRIADISALAPGLYMVWAEQDGICVAVEKLVVTH